MTALGRRARRYGPASAVAGLLGVAGVLVGGGTVRAAIVVGIGIVVLTLCYLDLRAQTSAQRADLRRFRQEFAAHRPATTDEVRKNTRDLQSRIGASRARTEELAVSLRATEKRLLRANRSDTAQIEAYLQLRDLAPPRAPLPPTRGWTASADYLLHLVDVTITNRPSTVVDLGSGLSTVWMAIAMAHHGIAGRVVAVEHDAVYAELTRELLARQGVADVAEVRVAPLVDVELDGETVRWYDPTVLADLQGIDLLSVDGPPGSTQVQARYPAVPLLLPRCAPGAIVMVDDMIRPDEQDMVTRWTAAHPELALTELVAEKGAVRLDRGARA